jgi:hypothetical protein
MMGKIEKTIGKPRIFRECLGIFKPWLFPFCRPPRNLSIFPPMPPPAGHFWGPLFSKFQSIPISRAALLPLAVNGTEGGGNPFAMLLVGSGFLVLEGAAQTALITDPVVLSPRFHPLHGIGPVHFVFEYFFVHLSPFISRHIGARGHPALAGRRDRHFFFCLSKYSSMALRKISEQDKPVFWDRFLISSS